MARVLEQHDRRRPGVGEQARDSENAGRRAIAMTPVGGATGALAATTSAATGSTSSSIRSSTSGASALARTRSSSTSPAIASTTSSPEAQRVLERVKALEHDERGIAPGVAEALRRGRFASAPRSRLAAMPDERFEDHLRHPRGRGRELAGAHDGAAGGAACGDLVRISLTVAGDRVTAAGFEASGCGAMIAAASAAVELAEGAGAASTRRASARRASPPRSAV